MRSTTDPRPSTPAGAHSRALAPDARLPAIAAAPPLASLLVFADQPQRAQTLFLLSCAVLPLVALAGRWDARSLGRERWRPLVAVAWGLCCLVLGATPALDPAVGVAAAATSGAVALLVHVVPGSWTRDGRRLEARRARGLPTTAMTIQVVASRAQAPAVAAALGLLLIDTGAAVAAATAALVLLLLDVLFEPAADDRRPGSPPRRAPPPAAATARVDPDGSAPRTLAPRPQPRRRLRRAAARSPWTG